VLTQVREVSHQQCSL